MSPEERQLLSGLFDRIQSAAANPRDKEAAHRAELEGIATADRTAVTCRKCLSLLYRRDKARKEGPAVRA